jgi:hypothetical protein
VTQGQFPGQAGVFDPTDSSRRLVACLLGRRWSTGSDGLIEVTAVEVIRDRWPIALRVTVENDDWSHPRRFVFNRSEHHTISGIGPAANAEAMAEEGLVLLELYLRTGLAAGLVEIVILAPRLRLTYRPGS